MHAGNREEGRKIGGIETDQLFLVHEELDYLFLEGPLADKLPLFVDVMVIVTEQDFPALRGSESESESDSVRC
jgi:hypothetical protein